MARVSVIGSGSYGVALAVLLHKNGHEVVLRSSTREKAEQVQRERRILSLPDVELPPEIFVTNDLESACTADLIVLAASSVHIRGLAHAMAPRIRDGQILVNVAKGIEESTLKTLSEQIEEEIPQARIAVLSGPSHAEEVGRGIPDRKSVV